MTTADAQSTRALEYAAAARRRRINVGMVTRYLLLAVMGLFFAFPMFWTLSSSLQTWQELRSFTPHLLPQVPQWQNYAQLFTVVPYARWMLNSFIIVAITVPGTLITATLVAYGFARFNFWGKQVWFVIMLGTLMIPRVVLFIPQYLVFFKLGWIDTYLPLTVGAWLGGGAFIIFLLRQFIMTIPRDLDEAAIIDGAGPLRILWSILVPQMTPALITAAILTFLAEWNDFFGPFIYLNNPDLYTAAVGLRYFQFLPLETTEPRDHLLMAAAAVMTVPVVLLFLAAQRYFISGITTTGIKG
jgi:multiple sugar transport system permease protein